MIDNLNQKCAPVLITTLNRYEHFVRCIESLRNNTWSKYTDIYIGLDYPKNQSHWNGYENICKYLEGEFTEFKSFNIIKRNENYGSSRNMLEMRENIFKNYDRMIRTDDDAEFSPNFLEYMNKCLEYYENDEDVIAVTGYSYPINWIVDNGSNVFKQNAIFHMWGTGMWRHKYRKLQQDFENAYLRKNFERYLKNIKSNTLIDARFVDFVNGVLCWSEGNLIDSISDISLSIYLGLENKSIIMPTISKVRNNGFDGSGENCKSTIKEDSYENISATNYNYSTQVIDKDKNFNMITSLNNNFEENKQLINHFDRRNRYIMLKTKFKLLLYKTLGEGIYKKVWSIKNKI